MYKIRVNVFTQCANKAKTKLNKSLKKNSLNFSLLYTRAISTEHAVKSLQAPLTTERIIGKTSLSAILK